MVNSQYFWQTDHQVTQDEEKLAVLQSAGLNFSPAFLRLCLNRGLDTVEKIQEATNQEPQTYHDPMLMHDMEKTINRLNNAIENQELILVYGDYDADGITSTLILIEALESMGANYSYYLPNRLVDGYGPNQLRYQQFIDEGVQLILTCDNGIAGFEAIDYAMNQGIDVIVTDHHEIQATLPNAFAIVHPRHPDGEYPFGDLSGAGVALKVAHALLGELPVDSMELAAIGTVADMVSLTDENRTIVLSGLNLISETMRLGLEKLLEHESVQLNEVTVDTIGFIVGPRLNAIGRLGDPTPALELLKSIDEEEIDQLIVLINQKNKERQSIVSHIYEQVIDEINAQTTLPNVIVAANKAWPAGVLGIVASRLTEAFNRPALVFQYQDEANHFRGSGRSIEGINLFEWLSENSDYLAQFGGHSQAAGLTVDALTWDDFKKVINQLPDHLMTVLEQPKNLKIDLSIKAEEVTLALIEEINLLSPFGMDNPKPLISVDSLKLLQKRAVGQTKEHIKFVVGDSNNHTVEGIGFSLSHLFDSVSLEEPLSIVGYLDINEWNGQKNPQVQLKDLKTEGLQIRDFRSSKLNPEILKSDNAIYIYEHRSVGEFLQKTVSKSNSIVSYHQIDDIKNGQCKHLVLMEMPPSLAIFHEIYGMNDWQKIDLGLYHQESKWLAGLPNKADFSHLYRYLYTLSQPFNLEEDIQKIAQQLNLPIIKLRLMLNIFFEVGFVTVIDGNAAFNHQATSVKFDLTQTNAYNKYAQVYRVEEILGYQSIGQVKEYLKELEK